MTEEQLKHEETASEQSMSEEESSSPIATILAIVVGLGLVALFFWYKWGRLADYERIIELARQEPNKYEPADKWLRKNWDDRYAPMVVELASFLSLSKQEASLQAKDRVIALLRDTTGTEQGDDVGAWQRWVWQQNYPQHEKYKLFKGYLFRMIDENYLALLLNDIEPVIPLPQITADEMVALRPALEFPAYNTEGTGLEDSDKVHGIIVDGIARAYPHRILAVHELIRDDINGQPIAISYCHINMGVFGFHTTVNGEPVTLGNSGLVYQGSKLLYDEATYSLWRVMDGHAVTGSMGQAQAMLTSIPVVTTTWAAWRAMYPDSTVIGFDTGFTFEYAEPDGPPIRAKKHPVIDLSDKLPSDQMVVGIDQGGFLAVPLDHLAPGVTFLKEQSSAIYLDEAGGIRVFGPLPNLDEVSDSSAIDAPLMTAKIVTWKSWYAAHPDTLLWTPHEEEAESQQN